MLDQINVEWSNLLQYDIAVDIKNEENIGTFCFEMKKLTDKDGNDLFALLASCALTSLCVPNSNAKSERVWSDLTLQKQNDRSNLMFWTIRAILLSLHFIRDKCRIKKFIPTEEMVNDMADGKASIKAKKNKKEKFKKQKKESVQYRGVAISNDLIKSFKVDDSKFIFKYLCRDDPEIDEMLRENIYPSDEESDRISINSDILRNGVADNVDCELANADEFDYELAR